MGEGVIQVPVQAASQASQQRLAHIVRMHAACERFGAWRRIAVTTVAVLSLPLLGQRLDVIIGPVLDRLLLTAWSVSVVAGDGHPK